MKLQILKNSILQHLGRHGRFQTKVYCLERKEFLVMQNILENLYSTFMPVEPLSFNTIKSTEILIGPAYVGISLFFR